MEFAVHALSLAATAVGALTMLALAALLGV